MVSKMSKIDEAILYLQNHHRKTLYIPKSLIDLSNTNCPSTGFHGNVGGMRNLYWGNDCLVALQSGYAYKLN